MIEYLKQVLRSKDIQKIEVTEYPRKDFKIHFKNKETITVNDAVKVPAELFSKDKEQSSYIFRTEDKVLQVFMDEVICIEAEEVQE